MTTAPTKSITAAATPRVTGSESSYTGYGEVGAHDWTDDQARTALWLRRNLPEDFAAIPFPFINLFSYNIHHDREQYMPLFDFGYYFADMRDPHLQVRMLTLESRDRNETRRQAVIDKDMAAKAAAEQAIQGDVSALTDEEVVEELHTVFP